MARAHAATSHMPPNTNRLLARSPSRTADFLLAHDAEADLDCHLKLVDLAVLHEPSHPGHLEPVQPLEALRRAGDRVANGLLDRISGYADELDDLVGFVRHGFLRSW